MGGGGIQKRIYLVEHPQGLDASQKRQRIAQDAGGYIKHPDPRHWMQPDSTSNQTGGGKNTRSSYADITHLQTMGVKNDNWKTKQRCMESRSTGFLSSSSSDRLTEEQENEIAENIYDWWISGKSYKQWYAEKFQQQDLFDKH